MFEIVKNTNDWLKDYKEQTYSQQLQEKLVKGLFEEHYKYSQQKSFKKILDDMKSLTEKQKQIILSKIDDQSMSVLERLGKKCVVYTLDPVTMEIEDIGGSSLLRDTKTGLYEPNMILDNFGNLLTLIFGIHFTEISVFKNDTNVSKTFRVYGEGGFDFTDLGGTTMGGMFGSSGTGLARSNFWVGTPLITAPENAYIITSGQGYNVSFQVIYNLDVIMGATETINEVITAGKWMTTASVLEKIAITRDIVGPISAVIGKLERAAFAWQL